MTIEDKSVSHTGNLDTSTNSYMMISTGKDIAMSKTGLGTSFGIKEISEQLDSGQTGYNCNNININHEP